MRIAVAPDKFAKAWPASDATPYECVDLVSALEATYDTDAHLIAYVEEGASYMPRVRKVDAPEWKGGALAVSVLFADVDNDNHAPWTTSTRAAFDMLREQCAPMSTCGVYLTAHGYRLVQPLTDAVGVLEAESTLQCWLYELERGGVPVDWACRDWTRHFRLPHVTRGGSAYRSPMLDLSRMAPRTITVDGAVLPPRGEATQTAHTAARVCAGCRRSGWIWAGAIVDGLCWRCWSGSAWGFG